MLGIHLFIQLFPMIELEGMKKFGHVSASASGTEVTIKRPDGLSDSEWASFVEGLAEAIQIGQRLQLLWGAAYVNSVAHNKAKAKADC